jgi:hypothetical protein
MPHEYEFGERLAMSSGVAASADVRAILLAQIPGAVSVTQASSVNDRQGVDWWVEMNTARHLAVDAKVRGVDWAASHPNEDDLALESWSVVENEIVGWTRDTAKRCDYVLWLWEDTGRFCLVPFPMLCKVFKDHWQRWAKKHKTRRQFTPRGSGGYHSECIFVPRREVWASIYTQFGGGVLPAAKHAAWLLQFEEAA